VSERVDERRPDAVLRRGGARPHDPEHADHEREEQRVVVEVTEREPLDGRGLVRVLEPERGRDAAEHAGVGRGERRVDAVRADHGQHVGQHRVAPERRADHDDRVEVAADHARDRARAARDDGHREHERHAREREPEPRARRSARDEQGGHDEHVPRDDDVLVGERGSPHASQFESARRRVARNLFGAARGPSAVTSA
jgi:hypothetical protein